MFAFIKKITHTHIHTGRNNTVNLQYERIFNLREVSMRTLHDFTCMLLSVTVQDVDARVKDFETKDSPINFPILKVFQ